jgi:hypothetical protein
MRTSAIGILAICAVVSMGGCSKARSDQSITTDIKARMFSDPQAKSASVEIAIKDGTVTLTGDVPDSATRYEVFKIATETPGVKKVEDQTTLRQAQEPNTESQPAPSASRASASPEPKSRRQKKERAEKHQNLSAAATQQVPAPLPAQTQNPASQASAPAPEPPPAAPVAPPPPPPPPQPKQVEIPAGTSVRVQMIDSVDSATNHAGDQFHASLAAPVVVGNEVVVPAGADVYVRLVDASSAGRMRGRSELGLALSRLEFQGQSYSLETTEYTQTGSSRGKSTAEKIGGGAAIGALIGAAIGGGKGAAIGAGVGGAGGTAAAAATKGQQVHVPAETKLDFTLQQPVTVTYLPDKNNSRR